MIYVGTSGWSYDDWVGPFYSSPGQDKLSYYAGRFNSVEVNSSFYRSPSEAMVTGWIRKISGSPGFRLTIKLPKDLSHDLILSSSKSSAYLMEAFEAQVLSQLQESGKLGALLMQLPPFFLEKHYPILKEFLESTDTKNYRYAVEFRNRYFYGNRKIEEELAAMNIATVGIDSPEYQVSEQGAQMDWGYLRFHGRNNQDWFKRSDDMSRYRYNYNSSEMKSIASLVGKSARKYKDLFVYFNNHPDGNAAHNGLELTSLLGAQKPADRSDITGY